MNFADGLKQLSRMCAMYKCEDCPMCDIDFCSLYQRDRSADTNEKAAVIIEKWSAEHPEPVYPTWVEWFRQIGVVPFGQKCFHDWLLKPIPADIAQKLGIEPKEGNRGT